MRPFGIIRILVFTSLALAFNPLPAPLISAMAESSGSKGSDLIGQASKAYAAGEYGDAAGLIEAAFKAGLTGELAARAILLRAQINERNGKLAGALQDYSNALWMESLQPADRKTASEGKARVMAAMGLSNSSASATRPASGPPSGPVSENSSGGVFGMFNGLFGSSESSKPSAPLPADGQKSSQTATAVPSAPSEPPPKKVVSAAPAKPAAPPNQERVVKQAPDKPKVTKTAANQPASAASISEADGYVIVFGSVNSQEAGRSKAQQIKAKLADILVSRNLDVEASPSGGFQIVAGPYKAKSAALALCSAMKQRGVGCQVVP